MAGQLLQTVASALAVHVPAVSAIPSRTGNGSDVAAQVLAWSALRYPTVDWKSALLCAGAAVAVVGVSRPVADFRAYRLSTRSVLRGYGGFIRLSGGLLRCRWPFGKSCISGRMRSPCDGPPPGGLRIWIPAPPGPPKPSRRRTHPFPQQVLLRPAGSCPPPRLRPRQQLELDGSERLDVGGVAASACRSLAHEIKHSPPDTVRGRCWRHGLPSIQVRERSRTDVCIECGRIAGGGEETDCGLDCTQSEQLPQGLANPFPPAPGSAWPPAHSRDGSPSRLALTVASSAYFGWLDYIQIMCAWCGQESSIVADGATLISPSRSLLGVLTRHTVGGGNPGSGDLDRLNGVFNAPSGILYAVVVGIGGVTATGESHNQVAEFETVDRRSVPIRVPQSEFREFRQALDAVPAATKSVAQVQGQTRTGPANQHRDLHCQVHNTRACGSLSTINNDKEES